MPLIAKVEERRQASGSDQDDVTAITPIAAVRTAAGHEHFSTETTAAVSAAPRLYCDGDLVDEHEVLLVDGDKAIVTMPTARAPLHASSPSAGTDCVMDSGGVCDVKRSRTRGRR